MSVLMPILSSFDVLVTLPADIVLNYTSLASRLLVVVTFCNRVINAWNSLPDAVVSARSATAFKRNFQTLDFSTVPNSYLVCTYDIDTVVVVLFLGAPASAGSPVLMSCLALFYVNK